MAWEEMTQRTCREHGGFEPDIRHRTNDATVSLALVARGLAVTLLPELRPARAPAGRDAPPGGRRARGAPDLRRHARVGRGAAVHAGIAGGGRGGRKQRSEAERVLALRAPAR